MAVTSVTGGHRGAICRRVWGGVGGKRGARAALPGPPPLRDPNMPGFRIIFDLSANRLRVQHELGPQLFEAEMVVRGDRMLGRALGTDPVFHFDLVRERPPVASVVIAVA